MSLTTRKLVLFWTFHILVLAVLSIIIVAECAFIQYLFSGSDGEQIVDIPSAKFEYQYYKRTSGETLNKESFGIVTLISEKMDGNQEYISERDRDGNEILISKFGSTEYDCKGSCICEMKPLVERRGSGAASPIIRGVSILVASISSHLAFDYARRELDQKCTELLTGDCGPSTGWIISEVDECEHVIDAEWEEVKEERESKSKVKQKATEKKVDDEKESKEEKEEEGDFYLCSGSCMTKTFDPSTNEDIRLLMGMAQTSRTIASRIHGLDSRLAHYADGYNCVKYTHEKKINYKEGFSSYLKDLKKLQDKSGPDGSHPNIPTGIHENLQLSPEEYFMIADLTEYCDAISRIDVFQAIGTSKEEVLRSDPILKNIIPTVLGKDQHLFGFSSLCSGHHNSSPEISHEVALPVNPSVICRRTK